MCDGPLVCDQQGCATDPTYQPADADQVATFESSPGKGQSAHGGWCAWRLTIAEQFACDPHRLKVVEGRLMVFLNDGDLDARALWKYADEAELIKKANAKWGSLAA